MRKITFMLIMLLVAAVSYSQVLVDETFDGATVPGSWYSYEVGAGSAIFEFGSPDMPTGDNFLSNAAIYDDDDAGNTGLNDKPVLYFGGPTNGGIDVSAYSNLILTYEYALQVFGSDGNQILNVLIWDNAASDWITIRTYDTDTNPTYDVINISNAIAANAGVDTVNFYFGFGFDDVDGSHGWGAGIDNVRFGEQVANDFCQNAITVPVNAPGNGCASPTIASNALASDSSVFNDTPSCGDFAGGDIWYSFVAPATGQVKVIVPVAGDWSSFATAVYDSCAANLPALDCQVIFGTGEITYTGLTPGNSYLLRAWDFANNDLGEVSFCIEETSPAPANDFCVNAITVPVNAAGTGCTSPTIASNVGATDSSPTNGTPACGSFAGADIWFGFTAPATGDIKVIVPVVGEWSSFATAVYDGCVGGGGVPELACEVNFDINGAGNVPSEVTYTGLTPGNSYILRAWDFSGNDFGEVSFCIEEFDSTASVVEDTIEGLTLYPNPIKDVLKVTAQDEISKITVFNLLGQEVKSINPIANNFSIDLSNLNAGIYIVKLISTDNKKSTRKIVKK